MVARLGSAGSLTERRQQHQTFGGPTYSEVLQPASDPLILRCLAALEATSGSSAGASSQQASSLALAAARLWQRLLGAASGTVQWLPTGCLQLLDTLVQVGGWVAPAAWLPSRFWLQGLVPAPAHKHPHLYTPASTQCTGG
jgi:hypothetical protein